MCNDNMTTIVMTVYAADKTTATMGRCNENVNFGRPVSMSGIVNTHNPGLVIC